jgi:hypothetical protein
VGILSYKVVKWLFKWGDQVVFQLQLTKDIRSVPNTRDYIY